MQRFYIAQNISGDTAVLTDPDQLHHLRDVLRLETGAAVAVFDSAGTTCAASLIEADKSQAIFKILARQAAALKTASVTIACALPKKDRMEDIVDKLTQLGVDRIIPLETERVIVKLTNAKKEDRHERWRAIALSAARQSHCSRLPEIGPVTPLPDWLSHSAGSGLKLVPTLCGDRRPLRELVSPHVRGNILVLIGPEGDFSPQELTLIVAAGFLPVTLGEAVLRVETAAVAVASYLCFLLE